MTHAKPRPVIRPAFSLIELLIVVGIITILIAATIVVGTRVTNTGKQRVTEGIIRVLDTSLSEYVHAEGRIPPPIVNDPRPGPMFKDIVQPVADARNEATSGIINSVGLYMLQCQSVPGADQALKGLNPKFVRQYDPDSVGTAGQADRQPALLTVFDGWGRPIRYVHPQFKGVIFGPWGNPSSSPPTQFVDVDRLVGAAPPGKSYGIKEVRRNGVVVEGTAAADGPDADAGLPANNRPYFYSAGADGKVGYEVENGGYDTIKFDHNLDNVFTTVPRYHTKY